nr:immunoglobulin light chain junction region [Macaca mulatta]
SSAWDSSLSTDVF